MPGSPVSMISRAPPRSVARHAAISRSRSAARPTSGGPPGLDGFSRLSGKSAA